jgi:hypothetical protein
MSKMRNINRHGFLWENFHPINSRVIVRAMDEKDFDPDHKLGMVQDNYDNSVAFEVVTLSPEAEAAGLKRGDVVGIISPALDSLGQKGSRYYSCELQDIIGRTTREEQPPVDESKEWVK